LEVPEKVAFPFTRKAKTGRAIECKSYATLLHSRGSSCPSKVERKKKVERDKEDGLALEDTFGMGNWTSWGWGRRRSRRLKTAEPGDDIQGRVPRQKIKKGDAKVRFARHRKD